MDISTFSTETLRQELRLRQARLAPAKRRRFESPIPAKLEEEIDEDFLFVPERRSRTSRNETTQSHKHLTRQQYIPFQIGAGRKRRRSPSYKSNEGIHAAIFVRNKEIDEVFKGKDAGRRRTADTQEEDRQLDKRLQAEEDDLLILMEGQWTNTCLGTKNCLITLDRGQTVFRSSKRLHRIANHEHASKPILKAGPHRQETLDAAKARQLQNEEIEAQQGRLHQAASRTQDCAACSETTLVIDLPSLDSCSHKPEVCRDCYASWIASQLESNGWQQVKCPGTSCNVQLTYDEIKTHASKEVFERYDAFKARSALSSDPNFRWCRALGCLSGQIHDVGEAGSVFVCVDCHARFCTVHEALYHEGELCEEYEYRTSGQNERDERKKEEKASEEALGRLAKKCPNEKCGSPIQKNGGCNHITCWKCRHEFCYVCLGGNWNRCRHVHLQV